MAEKYTGSGRRMLDHLATLAERWMLFGVALLSPLTLLFAVCAIGLTWASTMHTEKDSQALPAFLAIGATLAGGLLGSRIERLLGQHSDQLVLAARGIGDLRNLHMLANTISALKRRVQQHLCAMQRDDYSKDRLEGWLEEAIQTCGHVHGLTVNAIDTWRDIIPTANLPLQIEQIRILEQAVEEKEAQARDQALQAEQLKTELADAGTRSEQEAKALRDSLTAKQQELATTQKELQKAKNQLRHQTATLQVPFTATPPGSVLLGATGASLNLADLMKSGPSQESRVFVGQKCEKCGAPALVGNRCVDCAARFPSISLKLDG